MLASNAPANSIGIVGSPGTPLNLSAGISAKEPQEIIEVGSMA